jgi:hypothetical protein
MRRLLGVFFTVGLAALFGGSAHAASVTINDISDDFSFSYSYSTGSTHHDTVTIHVSGGNFLVEFILQPLTGDFKSLKLDIEDRVSNTSVLDNGKAFTTTLLSGETYDVTASAKRLGTSGTITYLLVINTLLGGLPDVDDCEDVPVLVRELTVGHAPIPGAVLLFASGLAFLGFAGRKTLAGDKSASLDRAIPSPIDRTPSNQSNS